MCLIQRIHHFSYCWWFRNPVNQLRFVVYPIIFQGLIHRRWLFGISSINSILHEALLCDSEGLPLSWYPKLGWSSNHDSLPLPDPFWVPHIRHRNFLFMFYNWPNSFGGRTSTNNDSSFRSFWWQYLEHLAAAGVRCQASCWIFSLLIVFALSETNISSYRVKLKIDPWKRRSQTWTPPFLGARDSPEKSSSSPPPPGMIHAPRISWVVGKVWLCLDFLGNYRWLHFFCQIFVYPYSKKYHQLDMHIFQSGWNHPLANVGGWGL